MSTFLHEPSLFLRDTNYLCMEELKKRLKDNDQKHGYGEEKGNQCFVQ